MVTYKVFKIVNTFIVTKYFKIKMSRKRDPRQVDFFQRVFEDATNTNVK